MAGPSAPSYPYFTYVGPSTGAAFTAGVFNDAWSLALSQVASIQTQVTDAVALAQNPQQIVGAGLSTSITLPPPPTPPVYDPNQITNQFNTYANQIETYLTTNFVSFLSTYFPVSSYLDYATTWIENVFTVGGTGFAPGVEDAIWQRDRARLVVDSNRASEAAVSSWASRGYPLPPGALNGTVVKLQQDLLDKIGSSGRDRAIEAGKIEIENLRFAVTAAIDLRTKAMQSAGEYIRTLALGPQIGSTLATAASEAQVRLSQVISQLYSATVTAAELPVRLQITNAELIERAAEANIRAASEAQHDRVQATLAAAAALGSVASSAVNSLHASAGIQASESL